MIRDLGFDAIVTLSLTDPGSRHACGSRQRRPPRSADHRLEPALRRPLGPANDPARLPARRRPLQPRPRRRRVALYESAAPTCGRAGPSGAGALGGSFAGDRPAPALRAPADRRPGVGPLRGPGGAARAAEPTSSRSRARSRGRSRAARVPRSRSRPARSRSCTRAAPGGAHRAAPRPAGSARSIRWSAAPGTSRPRRLRDRPRARSSIASPLGFEQYEDVITYPAVQQDIAVIVTRRWRPPGSGRGPRRRRRAAALDEVFDLYRGEQVGEGRKCLALRLEFRAPDRTLTDEEVAASASGSPARSPDRGVACVSESAKTRVVVAGASGYAGAPSRPSSSGAIRDSSWSPPPRAADAGTALTASTRGIACPIELTELDLDLLEDVEAGIVAYPHGAATPVVAGMRGLGLTVVDLSADFRLVDATEYERWYGPHGDPDLLENAVYGLTELDRERDPHRRARRQPRLLPDRGVARARPARRARRARARSSSTPSRACRARAAGPGTGHRWSTSPRT